MSDWIRVSKDRPCAQCGRGDWCTYNTEVACCMRVTSPTKAHNGGFIHRLNGDRPPIQPSVKRPPEGPALDAESYWRTLLRDTEGGFVATMARRLGVSAESLRLIGCAQYRPDVAAFPMLDVDRNVVGIRLRGASGRKWAVRGSRQGLFIPSGPPEELVSNWLVICEGPTDTAAMLTVGFNAIGRPSCQGCVDPVAQFVRRRDVVILADNDGPGLRGAEQLAQAIRRHARMLRLAIPPPGKDAREWATGVSRSEVACVIDNALDVEGDRRLARAEVIGRISGG